MALPLERIEGKYDIVAKLREGGMGAVYKVRHRLLDELRVVKVLRTSLAGDRELEDRFVREARAAIRLRHPNVVQIFDFSLDVEGRGFLVMEYIRGLDLQQVVGHGNRPPLPVPLVLEITRQSLRALAFLHRRGFVHRDISPDNLMLTRDVDERPLVKMIDLGIAKERGNEASFTATGVFLGKFRYASPEQFGAEEGTEIDERSDLYSFGIVLYQLLTQRFPIAGTTTSQLIGGHLLRPPLPFAESDPEGRVPEDLRRVVLRCLEKRPGDRFADATELEEEIAALQERHPLGDEELALAHRLTGLVHDDATAAAAPPGSGLPGSTQSRLDAGFRPEPTPPPTATTPLPVPPREILRPAPSTEQQRLDRHLHRAFQLAEEGDDEAAMAELEEALVLQPENATILGLLEEVRERAASRRSESAVAAAVRDIDELVASGRLLEADCLLFQADEAHGEHPLLAAARQRLGEVHHRELTARVREMIAEATAARDRGQPAAARELIAKAVAVTPAGLGLRRDLHALERSLTAPPRPSEEHDLLAAARRSQADGDLLRARLLVAHVLERDPKDAAARALARELDRRRA